MSYSSMAIRAASDQSDSRILIEACLARVRREAGLDIEPVLPPLDVLVGKTRRPSSRLVVGPSAKELPSAEAIVKSAVRPSRKTTAKVERPEALSKSIARRMRWPVFLCGFIGGIFGGVAFMTSPVGQKPEVQHAVTVALEHLQRAYAVAADATSRLVEP